MVGKSEHSFILCGLKIKYLTNNFQTSDPKKFYEIDSSVDYLTIKPIDTFNSGINYEMYCHSAENLLGPKAVEIKEPLFVCSYQFKTTSTDKGVTRVGFLTKTKPDLFIDLKTHVEDSIFNVKLCPFWTDEQLDKAAAARVYTNMVILTNEPVSFKRRQGNALVDERAYFYLYESNPKVPVIQSKLITLKMNELNAPQKYSPYSVNCVKDSQGVYKLYMQFMKIQSTNYLENTRVLEIKSIKFFENAK